MATRHDTEALGRGFASLGQAMFGSPQQDMMLSQAQAAQAQRQMTEQEMRQAAAQQAARQRLGQIFGQLDPGAEDFMGARQQALGMGFGHGMDPETLGQAARLFTGAGGGDFNQFTQVVEDPSDRLAIEQFNAQQRSPLGSIFGGDLPDFMQRAAAISHTQGIPFDQALAHTTGQFENIHDPQTGAIFQVPRFGDDVRTLHDPSRRPRPGEQPAQPGVAQAFAPEGQGPGTEAPETEEPVDGFETTLFDDLETSVGAIPTMQDALTRTAGQFSDRFAFPEVVRGRARLQQLKARLRPIFTVSNRPSMWELDQIEQMLPGDGLIESPARAGEVLTQIHNMLGSELQFIEESLADPQLDRNVRTEMERDRTRIIRELRTIGQPRPISAERAMERAVRGLGPSLQELPSEMGAARDRIRQPGQEAAPEQQGQPQTGLEGLSDEELLRMLQGGG